MSKRSFQIAIAISVGIFFLTVTIAHACIGTITHRGGHGCGGLESSAGRLQTSHTETQDETCTSVRDRFVSLAFGLSQTHSWFSDLHAIPVIREQIGNEPSILSAERPPGIVSIDDDQQPLYLFNSVFRI